MKTYLTKYIESVDTEKNEELYNYFSMMIKNDIDITYFRPHTDLMIYMMYIKKKNIEKMWNSYYVYKENYNELDHTKLEKIDKNLKVDKRSCDNIYQIKLLERSKYWDPVYYIYYRHKISRHIFNYLYKDLIFLAVSDYTSDKEEEEKTDYNSNDYEDYDEYSIVEEWVSNYGVDIIE